VFFEWSNRRLRGTVDECLDWLARYVSVGARHRNLRI